MWDWVCARACTCAQPPPAGGSSHPLPGALPPAGTVPVYAGFCFVISSTSPALMAIWCQTYMGTSHTKQDPSHGCQRTGHTWSACTLEGQWALSTCNPRESAHGVPLRRINAFCFRNLQFPHLGPGQAVGGTTNLFHMPRQDRLLSTKQRPQYILPSCSLSEQDEPKGDVEGCVTP
jgi:hypothetical protein